MKKEEDERRLLTEDSKILFRFDSFERRRIGRYFTAEGAFRVQVGGGQEHMGRVRLLQLNESREGKAI